MPRSWGDDFWISGWKTSWICHWNLPSTLTSCQLFLKRAYFPDTMCSMCILKRFTCTALTSIDGRWFHRSRWFCTTLCRMNLIHSFLKHKCNKSKCLPGHSIPSHFNIFRIILCMYMYFDWIILIYPWKWLKMDFF